MRQRSVILGGRAAAGRDEPSPLVGEGAPFACERGGRGGSLPHLGKPPPLLARRSLGEAGRGRVREGGKRRTPNATGARFGTPHHPFRPRHMYRPTLHRERRFVLGGGDVALLCPRRGRAGEACTLRKPLLLSSLPGLTRQSTPLAWHQAPSGGGAAEDESEEGVDNVGWQGRHVRASSSNAWLSRLQTQNDEVRQRSPQHFEMLRRDVEIWRMNIAIERVH